MINNFHYYGTVSFQTQKWNPKAKLKEKFSKTKYILVSHQSLSFPTIFHNPKTYKPFFYRRYTHQKNPNTLSILETLKYHNF